jgi:hypothetical protein
MPANGITGVKEVDAALAQFEAKVQRKYVRQALNNSVKIVEKDFKVRCPVETDEFGDDVGAMRDSAKRYTPKRKRNVQRRGLKIDKGRLMQLYFERKGRFPGKRRADSEPMFYPALIELGGSEEEPQRPLRGSLYDNETQIKAEFVNQLRTAVNLAGKDGGADVPEDNNEK